MALLPANIWPHMLSKLPLVDICNLDKTQFTSGLDMNSIWKQLYEDCQGTPSSLLRMSNGWKECLLSSISDTIFQNSCPYHYFQLSMRICKRTSLVVTDNHPVLEHLFILSITWLQETLWQLQRRRKVSLMILQVKKKMTGKVADT